MKRKLVALLFVAFAVTLLADDGPVRPDVEHCYSCNTYCASHAVYYGSASASQSGYTGCITHYGGCAGGCVWCEYDGWPCRYCTNPYECYEPSKGVDAKEFDGQRDIVAALKIAAFLSDSPFMSAEDFADFAAEVDHRIGSTGVGDAEVNRQRLAAYRDKYTEMTGRTLATWTSFPVWPAVRGDRSKRAKENK